MDGLSGHTKAWVLKEQDPPRFSVLTGNDPNTPLASLLASC